MYLEAQRFYVFLLIATFLSALGYYVVFEPTSPLLSLGHLSLPKWAAREKYAYATFLGPPTSENSSTADPAALLKDPYFISVRLLNYQIQYAEKTRTRLTNTPFLVLVLPSVPASQIAVLKKEGATIIPIEPLDLPEAFNQNFINNSRFRDVLAKLRLWELTSWDKVLYLDADSFLLKGLDGLFTEEELSGMQVTLPENGTEGEGRAGKARLDPPETYLMAASTDTYGDQTPWEEDPANHPPYLCACFMLFAPSSRLLLYYLSVLNSPEAPRDAYYPEQDLLIYVHRKEGRMPWRRIPVTWSANDGEMNEEYALKGGVKSLHVKGWEGAEGGNVANDKYKNMWRDLVKEMEDWWRERGRWDGLGGIGWGE
ncbi:glycosyltransferase family 8 protein [Trematosphaeria pertusa]|uniref:Glycosyltransferase family 8 protein n=1 Tax=Trematosphaeria pertusa TaxID=390896 RepID=A0A6A6ICE5_9PLEO|nr:glycosyltransferase family 8 protein [Trematosphaeria pertusa]KAF2247919.1 glycosyltransferase family 8 protein [Trematosphaeria pertusa]